LFVIDVGQAVDVAHPKTELASQHCFDGDGDDSLADGQKSSSNGTKTQQELEALLLRDCRNVLLFFNKQGAPLIEGAPQMLVDYVTQTAEEQTIEEEEAKVEARHERWRLRDSLIEGADADQDNLVLVTKPDEADEAEEDPGEDPGEQFVYGEGGYGEGGYGEGAYGEGYGEGGSVLVCEADEEFVRTILQTVKSRPVKAKKAQKAQKAELQMAPSTSSAGGHTEMTDPIAETEDVQDAPPVMDEEEARLKREEQQKELEDICAELDDEDGQEDFELVPADECSGTCDGAGIGTRTVVKLTERALRAYYEEHCPEKLGRVAAMLARFSEEEIMQVLQKKYGCTPELEEVAVDLQEAAEESFVWVPGEQESEELESPGEEEGGGEDEGEEEHAEHEERKEGDADEKVGEGAARRTQQQSKKKGGKETKETKEEESKQEDSEDSAATLPTCGGAVMQAKGGASIQPKTHKSQKWTRCVGEEWQEKGDEWTQQELDQWQWEQSSREYQGGEWTEEEQKQWELEQIQKMRDQDEEPKPQELQERDQAQDQEQQQQQQQQQEEQQHTISHLFPDTAAPDTAAPLEAAKADVDAATPRADLESVDPFDGALESLRNMGFEDTKILMALERFNGRFDAALEQLLTSA
jgi:hypothetical protein